MQEIQLKRLFKGDDSSLGALWIGGKPVCFIIEDEYRKVKVKGETRIPAGRYEIKKRVTESSPKTLRYREIYSWFDYHLELQNVPNFKYIYIHHGNKESDTDGCLLCNYGAHFLSHHGDVIDFAGSTSRDAFTDVYAKISAMLKHGEVFITVTDEI